MGARQSISQRVAAHIRTNIWGIVAVFIALGGTAAALPGRNTVDSGDIKPKNVKRSDLALNSVDSSKVADGTVTGFDVADNSLTGTDVDESTLNLPSPPAIPSTLPPSGPAGGDLTGNYPDPQIAPSSVGDAEITDVMRSLVFPASAIGEAGRLVQTQAEPNVASNGFAVALAFADAVFTDVVVNPIVPPDRIPGTDFEVRIYWGVADPPPAGLTDVIWRAEALGVSAGEPVDDFLDPQVQASPQGAGTADTLRIQTITLPGAEIQNGELLELRVMRMAGAGAEFVGDTLSLDALLYAVELRYPAVS